MRRERLGWYTHFGRGSEIGALVATGQLVVRQPSCYGPRQSGEAPNQCQFREIQVHSIVARKTSRALTVPIALLSQFYLCIRESVGCSYQN